MTTSGKNRNSSEGLTVIYIYMYMYIYSAGNGREGGGGGPGSCVSMWCTKARMLLRRSPRRPLLMKAAHTRG